MSITDRCRLLLLVCFATALASCSSCGKGDSAVADSGLDSSPDADADSDSDSDSDTDGDSDQDAGVLACPGVTDAGPWEWQDLPEGEDCGANCKQITFDGEVRLKEWDMWDERFAFAGKYQQLYFIDLVNSRQMKIPPVNPEFAADPPPIAHIMGGPSLYQDKLVYTWVTDHLVPLTSRAIRVDTVNWSQEVITDWGGGYKDQYNGVLVCEGQCDDDDDREVCVTRADAPCEVTIIAEEWCVGCGIWENTIIWISGGDVATYDLESASMQKATQDEYYQMWPHIHGRRIVYQDLRFGDNNPMGNWNHCAVFMYDLDTQETTQITSGEWIASYPDIHGDIIVWQDHRASTDPNNAMDFSGVEIWGYNISTEVEFQITDIPGRAKQTPRIWGDKVYVDMRNSEGNDIYRFDLPPEAL